MSFGASSRSLSSPTALKCFGRPRRIDFFPVYRSDGDYPHQTYVSNGHRRIPSLLHFVINFKQTHGKPARHSETRSLDYPLPEFRTERYKAQPADARSTEVQLKISLKKASLYIINVFTRQMGKRDFQVFLVGSFSRNATFGRKHVFGQRTVCGTGGYPGMWHRWRSFRLSSRPRSHAAPRSRTARSLYVRVNPGLKHVIAIPTSTLLGSDRFASRYSGCADAYEGRQEITSASTEFPKNHNKYELHFFFFPPRRLRFVPLHPCF